MRIIGQSMPTTQFPCTLPIGSGNEDGSFQFRSTHYFPDQEAEILAETTGAIGLEVETNNVAEGN
jgi:hypothetical protein